MISILYACSLNNQGSDLLASGDFSRAKRCLMRALSILKEAAKEVGLTCCTRINLSTRSEEAKLPFSASTLAIPGLQDMDFYIYDHGIMLSGTANGKKNKEIISLYSAVVLFNLALASHHEARLRGDEISFKRASLLYSGTVDILSASTMPDDLSFTLLTLLALNNKSQIYNDKCEYMQSVG